MASDAGPKPYALPHYLRYARTLALVSGTAVGIAAGAAVFSSSGCGCAGVCGGSIPPPFHADAAPDVYVDSGSDAVAPETASDTALVDAGADASDTGGGPRPAPLLPPAWVA